MANSSNATARIQITVELSASAWRSDCTVQQIYEQAGREAVNKLGSLLQGEARIIGDPKVIAVLVERP